jgi:hypothetical protein
MHRLRPLSLREANAYVTPHHRHSKRVLCHKFSIGLEADGDLVGVAIVALPIARGLADGFTAEVRRVCTLGHPNACSTLYSAARKTALAMGFTRIVTYIREDELGTSLKAAGWHPVQVDRRRNHWDDHPRPASAQERVQRVRWEAGTAADPPVPALAPRARVKLPREQRRHIAKRLALVLVFGPDQPQVPANGRAHVASMVGSSSSKPRTAAKLGCTPEAGGCGRNDPDGDWDARGPKPQGKQNLELQTPDRRPFAAIRRWAALERNKARVAIRSLPTGFVDLHIVVLAACAVVSLEGVTSVGYVMDSAGG